MENQIFRAGIVILIVLISTTINAQTSLFTPASPISSFGSVSSPGAEQFPRIIDGNVNTKYLDFNFGDGMGFTVDIGTAYTARTLAMTTANDFVLRDPTSFTISGSNNNVAFTTIATVGIPCITNRFFTRNFNFTNNTAYRYYRIVYNGQCGAENSIQVAETQIFYPTSNISITSGGTCNASGDVEFTTQFNVSNGTGDYEVYATAANALLGINAGDVLGTLSGAAATATNLSITSTISSPVATTLSVNVRDANTTGNAPTGNNVNVNIPDCYPITNTSVLTDGTCGNNYGVSTFTVQFDATSGSGEYSIIVATANPALGLNVGDVLGSITGAAATGVALTIDGTYNGTVSPATTLDVNIIDTGIAGTGLAGNIITINLPECIATIPTLNEWGLIILALLLLNLSILLIVKKKSNRIKHERLSTH